MNAETTSASIVNHLALAGNLPSADSYYRSRLFIPPFTTNPLVAAASPVLSLLERLCICSTLPPIENLRESIEHELLAFHSRLNGKAGSEELDVIATYLLCATIDELIGKNYLRIYGKAAEFKAFTPSSYAEKGPEERFFMIVDYIKERPNQYLDLIELTYYCLITGFEGKHHGRADGRQTLDNLLEELFQLIKLYRVNKTYHLLREPKKNDKNKTATAKPKIYLALGFLGVFILAYSASYFFVESKARLVQFGHAAIAKLDH